MTAGEQDAPVPVLTDGVVTLRALREDDLGNVVEQSRDPLVRRWSLTVPSPYTRDDAEAFLLLARRGWDSGERWQWAVEAEGRFAGLVDLTHRGEGVREIGYATHPRARGRGLTTRAARLAVGFARDRGCPLVLWHAAAGNVASRRVAWHTGFRIGPGETRALRLSRVREVWSGTLAADDPLTPSTPWLRPAPLRAAAGRAAVRLRPWDDDDGTRLPEGADPTPTSYAAWHRARLGREAAGAVLAWAVTPDDDPARVLGRIELEGPDGWLAGDPRIPARVQGWLTRSARGRGVAGAALDAVLAHALAPGAEGGLGLGAVQALVGCDDRPALRLLRRSGLHDVGPTGPAERDGATRLLLEVTADDDRVTAAVEPVVVPVLETARLRLRPFRDDDAPGPADGPDGASHRFLPAGAHPDTASYPAWVARQRRRQDAADSLPWCVANRTDDRALGFLGVFRMEPLPGRFDAEVGYWLVPSARGKGYAGEVLEAAVTHALTPLSEGGLGLTRLHAGTDTDNLASQATLERAGFRRWGADRQAWRRTDGTLSDGAYYELLAADERVDRRAPGRPLREVRLEGDGVRVRSLRSDDALRVAEGCSDPRTRHWLATLPSPYGIEHARSYVARARERAATGDALLLAVAATDDDRLVGAVSLMDLRGYTPGQGEVGYWTHPDARGRGVMTRAVRLAVRHAFAPVDDGGLGLRRLVLKAAAGNGASQHVAAAAGFVVTGRQRGAELLGDGTWDDLLDHDLLAAEWDARAE